MSSPLSGENTLDRVIGYCQRNGISTVDARSVPSIWRRDGLVVRVGNIVFSFNGHDTGNDVNGWIINGDEAYHFLSVPYWFSSHYCFNKSTWERGAWDKAVDDAIAELRTLMDAHKAKVAKQMAQKKQAEEQAAAEHKAKFEAQFARLS